MQHAISGSYAFSLAPGGLDAGERARGGYASTGALFRLYRPSRLQGDEIISSSHQYELLAMPLDAVSAVPGGWNSVGTGPSCCLFARIHAASCG
jgi:hypothetical protein